MKIRFGVMAAGLAAVCSIPGPLFGGSFYAGAPAAAGAAVPASFAPAGVQAPDDGFDQLPPGLKARSMSTLIRMGLVHPYPGLLAPQPHQGPPHQPATAVTWGAPANTSQSFGGPNEPAAGMNATNPLRAMISGNNFINVPCDGYNTTTDGGLTWVVQDAFASTGSNCGYGDGVNAWLPGNINGGHSVLAVALNPSGDGADMTTSLSTDDGVTWAGYASNIDTVNFFDDRQYLWSDNNPASPFYGRVYVTEALFDPAGSGSFNTVGSKFSTDGGATWSSFVPLVDHTEFATGTNHNEYPSIAILPNGHIVEAWHRGSCCGVIVSDNKVAWSRSTDGGVTWTSGDPTPAPGTIVDVPLARTISFNSNTPGGFRWSDSPNIAADPTDGTLYAVWIQRRLDNLDNSSAAYMAKSTDEGDTWSAPFIPFNDPVMTNWQYMPWISVAKDHSVHLTYGGSQGSNSVLAQFYTQSTDGGATWSTPFMLSSGTFAPAGFMGDYQASFIGGRAAGQASIIAGWTDTHAGVENQWARIGSFPEALCGTYSTTTTPASAATQITPGITDTGNHCDNCTTNVALPFTFTFHGTPYTSVNVSSDGYLQFGSNTEISSNTCLPNNNFIDAILPFWADLDTSAAGDGIFTSVSGSAPNQVFNIEWRAHYHGSVNTANFEVRFYEDEDRFDVVYGASADSGATATAGVQLGDGSAANGFSQFSCNAANLVPQLMNTYTESCCPVLHTVGDITAEDPKTAGALTLNGVASACGAPKSCPGPADANNHSYDIYPLFNGNTVSECVTVTLGAGGCGANPVFATAYLGSFDPANICAGYLADPGSPAPQTFSFDVPPQTPYVIVVNMETAYPAFCSGYTLDVSIPQPPTAVASGGGTVCQFHPATILGSGGATCSWTPTTGLSDPNSCSPSATPPAGTTIYTLTVTDACGVSSTNNPTVTFNVVPGPDPTITASGPTAFCEGGSVTLTAAAGAASYLWSPNGQTTQSIVATATGNYSCQLTGGNGCVTTSETVAVSVHAAPVAVASGSATICNGASTPLTGSGATNCSWMPVTGLDNPLSCTPNASPGVTTTYSLTVTDDIGCSSVNPAQVTVATNPLPTAGNNGPVCAGQTLQLTCNIISGAVYSWTGPNGFSSGLRQPQIVNATLADAGDYTVTATLAGCPPYTSTTTAAITPAPSPAITVTRCLAPNTSGLTASVPANAGDTYAWTITGGTIDSGQGTDTISFTSGGPATLMTLGVTETNGTGCSGNAAESMQVDFNDVAASNPFYNFICTIARNGITAGCGGGNYCPTSNVLRSQMAVFLLRGEHGSAYVPPAATGIFGDVAASNPFAPWIEQLYNESITGGCSTNPLLYCPNNAVSRAGMAVFLLVAEHGTGYVPPACTGIFTDVACPGPFTNFIEELYTEGITGGCNTNPLQYCPASSVTRAQMSVFLTVTFALP